MKKTILYLSVILLSSCSESVSNLKNPLTIDGVELSDSASTGGRYKVFLGINRVEGHMNIPPYFYTNKKYASGEELVQLSQVRDVINTNLNPIMDSVVALKERIKFLEKENENLNATIKEKSIVIKYLSK